jgi:hypothetical protein
MAFVVLSSDTGFASGTPCNLRESVPEEIAKLDADSFDFDSDSDLEDDEEEPGENDKGKVTATSSVQTTRCAFQWGFHGSSD